jgi:hypothetical protein
LLGWQNCNFPKTGSRATKNNASAFNLKAVNINSERRNLLQQILASYAQEAKKIACKVAVVCVVVVATAVAVVRF